MLRSISQALPIRASLAVFMLLGIAVIATEARSPASTAMFDATSPALERQEATQLLVLRAARLARDLFVTEQP